MATRSRSYVLMLLVILCASNLIIPATSRTTPKKPRNLYDENQVALFIFGDSFYDFGNNNYFKSVASGYSNSFPYGRTFFNYSSGRVTDGRNLADYIAAYLNLPLIAPYLLPGYHRYTDGTNFAFAGAGALNQTNLGLVVNLNTQVQYFKEVKTKIEESVGHANARSLLNKALLMISIGTVDYQSHFVTNTALPGTVEAYIDVVVGNITTALKELYNSGGRRFGILNILPMGCTPLLRAMVKTGCMAEANRIAVLHNAKLNKTIKKLKTQLNGFEYSIFNLHSTVGDRMKNPSKYGFKVGDSQACCGSGPFRGQLTCGMLNKYEVCENPNEYVHFDGVHPTDKVYGQLAELMWSGSREVASPQNLKKMLKL